MKRFGDLSIRYKLAALTAVTTTLALGVCCVVFVSNDIRLMRRSKVDQLTAIADVIAHNSTAALSFRQQESAISLLESLSERRTIVSAWMLDDRGEVFAEYSRKPGDTPPLWEDDSNHLYQQDGSLYVRTAIVEDGETLGLIVVHDSLEDLSENIGDAFKITIVVLAICSAIGLSVSLPLNRFFSKPILDLASTAQQVSLGSKRSVRARHHAGDEIGVLYNEFNAMLSRIEERDEVIRKTHQELQQANDRLEERVQTRTQMLELANEKLTREMEQSEKATMALREAQAELIEASRKAGMADVANSVLHNVGNVLNSLNVSAAVITERVREMRIAKLQQCVTMILHHDGDLNEFLTSDAKGRIIPQYLPNLVDHITGDQQQVLGELELLTKNVEHIKDIVRAQQSHAGTFGVIERCKPAELMEDALKFSVDSIRRHGIELRRDYAAIEEVQVEKARLLQILVNLIKNAKESVLSESGLERKITLSVCVCGDDRIRYAVSDTGAGIDASQLTSIFSYGFTTKSNGHGFGLHASANFAKQMGGELTAASEGPGRGATFAIELPRRQAPRKAPTPPAALATC
ncbi:MAG: ATP-binding protein [Pirellulales bacterium]|nr:ATP-binding protein [Pirellulales bacterium]